MDLGDDPAHDFLLDQDVGSVTLCDLSQITVFNIAPCKRMPNFSDSGSGLLQPLLSIVGDDVDI